MSRGNLRIFAKDMKSGKVYAYHPVTEVFTAFANEQECWKMIEDAKKREDRPMPRWEKIAFGVCLLVVVACFAGAI